MKITPIVCAIAAACSSFACAQLARPTPSEFGPDIVVPESSVQRPKDLGLRAHTNHLVFVGQPTAPYQDPPFLHGPFAVVGPPGYTPNQLKNWYHLPLNGGTNVIYIVDAFHFASARQDFNTFSSQFGLPTESSTNPYSNSNKHFQVVFANGSQPSTDSGWNLEEALDIEWAHAIAPNAKIVLVEAASNSFSDLMQAVDVASASHHPCQISMSWSGGEFGGELGLDSHFLHAGCTYFASSGDVGGTQGYPCMCPTVTAVGGTSLYIQSGLEYGWSGSGGGPSSFESRPAYQNVISGIVGSRRGGPDIAFDADPNTGVPVYEAGNWYEVGGTSLSAPCIAAVCNLSGTNGSPNWENGHLYRAWAAHELTDIISGSAGGFNCLHGWDFVTGTGVPHHDYCL